MGRGQCCTVRLRLVREKDFDYFKLAVGKHSCLSQFNGEVQSLSFIRAALAAQDNSAVAATTARDAIPDKLDEHPNIRLCLQRLRRANRKWGIEAVGVIASRTHRSCMARATWSVNGLSRYERADRSSVDR